MVNVSTGWREQRSRLAADVAQLSSGKHVGGDLHVSQAPLTSHVGQAATTRTMACPICKALYTPAPAHQQLVLAPHIVLESAFMSMCHFCFRCRRAACPDCWDAVHGICGACVADAQLPFRTQVKPLHTAMPLLSQEQQAIETPHAAPALMCIQHGKFYVKPGRDDGRPQGATPPHYPSPVPTMSALSPRDRHSRDGGGAEGWWGPLRASVIPPARGGKNSDIPSRASVIPPASALPSGWITDALSGIEQWLTGAVGSLEQWLTGAAGSLEQWLTGALLVLLLAIVTMIVLAEASPSANAQIMHVFQIDIRSEVAYLIHLVGQLQW